MKNELSKGKEIITYIFIAISILFCIPCVYYTHQIHLLRNVQWINKRKPEILLVYGCLITFYTTVQRPLTFIAQFDPNFLPIRSTCDVSYAFSGHGLLWALAIKLRARHPARPTTRFKEQSI